MYMTKIAQTPRSHSRIASASPTHGARRDDTAADSERPRSAHNEYSQPTVDANTRSDQDA
ncbi:hypothetical protein Hrd1104_02290 [Halorhabdus sp. CBA1104]|nr:hypothetical protein Hrd1104_02290 [Halorhabdus sp. CBA1104]